MPALFLDYHEESGAVVTVEVFPRANGNTLVTAFSDQAPLPLDPAAVAPEPGEIDRLQAICGRLSPMFGVERIIARQACFRPVTQDGLPLIGRMPQIEGVYVATGHNVWGILNAPATGEALAELIADGVARSTDLTPFDPMRLQPLTRRYCAQANQRASALAGPTSPKPRKLLVFHGKHDAPIRTAEICRVDRKRPGDKIAIRPRIAQRSSRR